MFFASSHRHQPWAKHLLFTNAETVPTVDGVDVGALLARLGVEVVPLPLTFVTPPGHFHAYRNQFYVFDITTYLAGRLATEDAALVLDADCVWIADVAGMRDALRRDGVLTYVESYPVDWRANGMTRQEMQAVASQLLGFEVSHPLVYCGGEVIAATAPELRRLCAEIPAAWEALLRRHERGETVFNEEAQLLSYIYYKLGYPLGNADPYVRRILTGSFGVLNTALPHDHGLVVWHLPLEKRLGLTRLYAEVVDPTSRFWSIPLGRDFREYLGTCLGVPTNPLEKRLRDLGQRVFDKLRYG